MSLRLDLIGQGFDVGLKTWTRDSAILYALGVGAGSDGQGDLQLTTENTDGVAQQVLPTFAVILESRDRRPVLGDYHQSSVLHAQQSVQLFGALPVEGSASTRTKVIDFYDKGANAFSIVESTMTDTTTSSVLAVSTTGLFIRGEGGFGGTRGPAPTWEQPDGPPDRVVTYSTRLDQALLYRLSGDKNPLHSDPGFAERAGFDRPILHGLCTYGFTGRALLSEVCNSDVAQFGSMSVRFSSPVLPGETLSIHIWVTPNGCIFRTYAGGRLVLDHGTFERRPT